jgi:hypothetical protein
MVHGSAFQGAAQKVSLVFQPVFFLDAAQGAFNAAGQLVNAAALARASFISNRNALVVMSDYLGVNNTPRMHFG